MNCTAVRDRLPEHALGVLASREAEAVDRHIAWCAACRKESVGLERATATFGFALAPAPPPAGLEDRVVAVVRDASRKRRPAARRGPRTALAAMIAAMIAVASLGWGAVMAGRGDRLAQANADVARRNQGLKVFIHDVLLRSDFKTPGNRVFFGKLSPAASASGSAGAAAMFVSPSGNDFAIVMVSGLSAARPDALPYNVSLVGDPGPTLAMGAISKLDSSGAATIGREFQRDLTPYTRVEVRDASGALVMAGSLSGQPSVSPSP